MSIMGPKTQGGLYWATVDLRQQCELQRPRWECDPHLSGQHLTDPFRNPADEVPAPVRVYTSTITKATICTKLWV